MPEIAGHFLILIAAVPEFQSYGAPHVMVLALTLAIPAALGLWLRALEQTPPVQSRVRNGVAWSFVIILLTQQVLKVFYTATNFEIPWTHYLPLHLCDLVLFVLSWALITRQQWAFVLAYFWGLAGTIQGLLTPDLHYGFPHPYFFFFFLSHGGIVAGALFLVWGCGMRPRPQSILLAWGGILGYAAVVFGVNTVLGTNFGYLNARPNAPSLLDHFWDPPAHIAQMAMVALIFFLILYAPFYFGQIIQRRRGRKRLQEKSADEVGEI